jgi:type VI secretion system protein VasD
MEADAQFVAVVGLFRYPDMENNTWKLVIEREELDPDKPRILEAGNNHLSYSRLRTSDVSGTQYAFAV